MSTKSLVPGVPITRPQKALWPDGGDDQPVTKLDLARYYEAVGPWMLMHIKCRPCSIIRAPDGIGGELFLQRHPMLSASHLLKLTTVSVDHKPYLQVNRVEDLAAVAQSAGLEVHRWNCRSCHPDQPGRLVFDLDPATDVAFDGVIAAAHEMRERLESFGLIPFCKTTGGKGLHVVTPLSVPRTGEVDWPTAKICVRMAADRYLCQHAGNATCSQDKTNVFRRPASTSEKHRYERPESRQNSPYKEIDCVESRKALSRRGIA
jgi:bifunctional non-homologous end joining protein LigD